MPTTEELIEAEQQKQTALREDIRGLKKQKKKEQLPNKSSTAEEVLAALQAKTAELEAEKAELSLEE